MATLLHLLLMTTWIALAPGLPTHDLRAPPKDSPGASTEEQQHDLTVMRIIHDPEPPANQKDRLKHINLARLALPELNDLDDIPSFLDIGDGSPIEKDTFKEEGTEQFVQMGTITTSFPVQPDWYTSEDTRLRGCADIAKSVGYALIYLASIIFILNLVNAIVRAYRAGDSEEKKELETVPHSTSIRQTKEGKACGGARLAP